MADIETEKKDICGGGFISTFAEEKKKIPWHFICNFSSICGTCLVNKRILSLLSFRLLCRRVFD